MRAAARKPLQLLLPLLLPLLLCPALHCC